MAEKVYMILINKFKRTEVDLDKSLCIQDKRVNISSILILHMLTLLHEIPKASFVLDRLARFWARSVTSQKFTFKNHLL